MACFTKWTVLPHEPLQKAAENLWWVRGTMPDGKTTRVMTVAKRSDGDLLIHNAIALEDPLMAELEEFGKPTFLAVPNGFHRQDAKIWKDRYPEIKVISPRAVMGRVAKVVEVEGSYPDIPKDATVQLVQIDGTKQREGVLVVYSDDGISLVFTDAVVNVPRIGGFLGFLLAPTGKPAVPRVTRWMVVSDRDAFRSHMQRLAALEPLRRVLMAHGAEITTDCNAALRGAISTLG